jgi:hypothetical protein
VSDAQTWTLIGGFLAILAAMSGLVLALVRAEIAVLREHVDGHHAELLARFAAVERELERLHVEVFAGETER